jgi:DNA modification methylase
MITQYHGSSVDILPTLEPQSVQCIVTSPPYWRMRHYTDDPREIGREDTPAAYVAALVAVFREAWRVLRDDGTLWLNLGDAYADDRKWGGSTGGKSTAGLHGQDGPGRSKVKTGLPPKSLIGLPWRGAVGLQDDGWVLRSEIIWHKPSAMPESVTDRPTAEPPTGTTPNSAASFARKNNKRSIAVVPNSHPTHRESRPNVLYNNDTRNARTVWSIATEPLRDEHYAPMPSALAERCIKAGSRPGDTILDPFGGSGTTARAAIALQRRSVLIDLGYQELQQRRADGVQIRLNLESAV